LFPQGVELDDSPFGGKAEIRNTAGLDMVHNFCIFLNGYKVVIDGDA
jgi:hypothetical protein